MEGLDGVEKIYDLRTFSNAKSSSSIKEVRHIADQVYGEMRHVYFAFDAPPNLCNRINLTWFLSRPAH